MTAAAAPLRRRRPLRRLAVALVALAVALLAAEGSVRLAGEGPEPERRRFTRQLTVPDAELLYRLRPGAAGNWRDANVHETEDVLFTVNEAGRRGPDVDTGGPGEPLLVAVLGDSSTMGYGVADGDTYCQRLGAELAARLPGRRVRVLNFGVFGYTSRQGRAQLLRDVLPLRPDVVVLAFGFNDAYLNGVVEDSAYASLPPPRWLSAHALLERHSALYRALWQHARPLQARERMLPRIGAAGYGENLAAMVVAAREAGALAVLLDVTLPTASLREAARGVAERLAVPRVEALALFEQQAAGSLAVPLTLRGDDSEAVTVRWRGLADPVLVVVDLDDPSRAAHAEALRDDGQQGDAAAGDGVFTACVPAFDRALRLEISVLGQARLRAKSEALNHVFYRRLLLGPGQGLHGPVWSEELWLEGLSPFVRVASRDVGHPTARGHALIGEALAATIAAELPAR